MSKDYDAIIVGARCAGSPLAMLLARKGYRVLLMDRASFPSDTMSTHFLAPQATQMLKDWGLLERLERTDAPPLPEVTFHLGDVAFSPPPDPTLTVDATYCPRRTVLDKLLVDAASEAGAEVRERFPLQELIVEDGEVRGIEGGLTDGPRTQERAQIVVGADGMRSRIARLVGAEAYDVVEPLTCGYYSYWEMDWEGAHLYLDQARKRGILAFPTNDGLTCVAAMRERSEFAIFRSDIEREFMDTLTVDPKLHAAVASGRRAEKWVGGTDFPNFFRTPWGAGWALVGDAGYYRDPITGLGIMDAFRDAGLLAEAIDDGLSGRAPMADALARYQRQRDEAAKPLYEFTLALARFEPVPPPAPVAT
jgi:flavin-dependent dehydrogenase